MSVINPWKEQAFHLVHPVDGVRCAAPQAETALSTEGDGFLRLATWAHKLAVAVILIATAEHLLDDLACGIVFRVLTKELGKPLTEDQLKCLKGGWLRLNHPDILAESQTYPFRINGLKSKFQGDQRFSV